MKRLLWALGLLLLFGYLEHAVAGTVRCGRSVTLSGATTGQSCTAADTVTTDVLEVGSSYHSVAFMYRITAGTATIRLENSLDGTNWHTVDSSTFSSEELLTVQNPVGWYRGYHTACSSATTHVLFRCGAGAGGRP